MCHHNQAELDAGKDSMCKKQLGLGRMSSDECRRRIIAWLLAGAGIPQDADSGRREHLRVKPQSLDLEDDAALEQRGLQLYP